MLAFSLLNRRLLQPRETEAGFVFATLRGKIVTVVCCPYAPYSLDYFNFANMSLSRGPSAVSELLLTTGWSKKVGPETHDHNSVKF